MPFSCLSSDEDPAKLALALQIASFPGHYKRLDIREKGLSMMIPTIECETKLGKFYPSHL